MSAFLYVFLFSLLVSGFMTGRSLVHRVAPNI